MSADQRAHEDELRRERDALLALVERATDGEAGWQDVAELQRFLREGVVTL